MTGKKETAAQRRARARQSLCGTCYQPFDGKEAAKAAREGRAFIHECGRVLVRAR